MDAAAGVAVGRGVSLPISQSQSARKEWRAVPNTGPEDMDRLKLGQSDERAMYEHGASPHVLDFCSTTLDGAPNKDLLHQRLVSVSRQRKELQQVEIELRAQVLARAEISEMQKSFEVQIKEHENAAANLKEELKGKEVCICNLEKKMEEMNRELRAVRIDNEAAWAKEDLLREQNKELATFRRERDDCEAERAQHLKQICELKECIHEKENQIIELEEQHRVAQETILYKDEQLREAQAWVARVQEMDALQSTTNHSLQAELHERTEQFNHFWLGCQRQFAEMERLHVQTIQQLQLELAEAKGRTDIRVEPESGNGISQDTSVHFDGQKNASESISFTCYSGVKSDGNTDNGQPLVSSGNVSAKVDHISGVPIVPSSLLGMGSFLPPGQLTALHPFLIHQQGISQTVPLTNSHIPPSHITHFQGIAAPTSFSHQQWQNAQASLSTSQIAHQQQYQTPELDGSAIRSNVNYDSELQTNGCSHSNYLNSDLSSPQRSGSVIMSSVEELQPRVIESDNQPLLSSQDSQILLEEGASRFPDMLGGTILEQKLDSTVGGKNITANSLDILREAAASNHSFHQKDDKNVEKKDHSQDDLSFGSALPVSSGNPLVSNGYIPSINGNLFFSGMSNPRGLASSALSEKTSQPALLDERSLLACIVRAIPAGAGGQIRISTTLPNRLAKMLAPLHWHDYRRHYGKLDEFVARHPELFVIEGDLIHLRDGAQEIISATTAAAKVAAAAAVSSSYNSVLPSVAVTPVAHSSRVKRSSSLSKSDASSRHEQHQQINGLCYSVAQDIVVDNAQNNGVGESTHILDRKCSNGVVHGASVGGKRQERVAGARITSRMH